MYKKCNYKWTNLRLAGAFPYSKSNLNCFVSHLHLPSGAAPTWQDKAGTPLVPRLAGLLRHHSRHGKHKYTRQHNHEEGTVSTNFLVNPTPRISCRLRAHIISDTTAHTSTQVTVQLVPGESAPSPTSSGHE